MTAADEKRDFFISFNQADRGWATWIAWVLEEQGWSVFFQDWDFRGSFVEQMHRALKESRHTAVILSDSYLRSEFALSEVWNTVATDPVGRQDRVVPIKIAPLTEDLGYLRQFAYLDLTGMSEGEAERRLGERARKARDPDFRGKPFERPLFPGARPAPVAEKERKVPEKPSFPIAQHNLPPCNPDFVGREDVLAQLHEMLAAGDGPAVLTQAIHGLGGIGKTQTALAYAYRHLAAYRLIWWLRADDSATLADDFGALAAPLGLDPDVVDQQKLNESIRRTLQVTDGWLLIFDNVEDPALPRRFLPGSGGGRALITSRRSDWRNVARPLPLAVMAEGEGLRLLTGGADPGTLHAAERADAAALAAELGYLPLALAQARAYTQETGRKLADYRALLAKSRPKVLARGQAGPDYPESVARTWQISIDAAAAESPAARELLDLLAFFAPDDLPLQVLSGEPIPDGLKDEVDRDTAIAALNRYSLIRAAEGSISVHRLVQAVTRDGLDDDTVRAYAEMSVRLIDRALPNALEYTNWPAIGVLLPHALATAAEAKRCGAGLGTAATVLNSAALAHELRADFAGAEPLYQRAIAIGEETLGPAHPNLAIQLNNLANLYRETGRTAEAEPLYQRAIAIGEKTLGPEHPDLAARLNNLAELYRQTGRTAEAEPLYQRAIAIHEKALGPEHPGLATGLNNLANLYRETGPTAEAEPLYQRAIAIGEKTLGPEHPDLATWLNNLAGLYRETGRTAEAEPLYQRAIAIVEKTLPPQHPHVLMFRKNCAILLDTLGRHDEAAALRAKNNRA
ncbi:MAG: tetratricopeptide repeat protein [Alphaproteobacteria bacterium]|jgi:tetratricopeptide (TPR) repeat protein|nr:tetratricopeptide repeat protein [Alphaproteobacteria bacterium]